MQTPDAHRIAAELLRIADVRLKARLHHHNGRYSVLFDGNLLVEGSRDPECDAARALLAQGITGKLTLCDGKTGRPRTIIVSRRLPS